AELGVDHRAFVDDDQARVRGRRVVPQLEARRLLAAVARAVDHAVDGRGVGAALAAHYQRGLAGERAEYDLAVDVLGEMTGERGLAGARIAKQAKDLRRAAAARARLEPGRHGLERGVLMRGEDRHEAALRGGKR